MDLYFATALILCAAGAGGLTALARPDLSLSPWECAIGGGAVAGVLAALWLARPDASPGVLPLFAGLGPLAWIDARRRLLPDPLTLPLIVIGLLVAVAEGRGIAGLTGAASGYAAFRLIGLAWERWRGVDALGHGDAKLMAAIGAFLGPWLLPQIVLIAATVGIALALILRAVAGKDEIPFGPPLVLAAVVSALTGPLPV